MPTAPLTARPLVNGSIPPLGGVEPAAVTIGNFKIIPLSIRGVIVLEPRRYIDERGYFSETFRAADFSTAGVDTTFIQDNQAMSARAGTLRGLHFQFTPHQQGKLVRVLRGSIFDVAVDLRCGSSTFGKWAGATLTAEGGEQLYLPRGFAHGYCTLEDDTEIAYKCDAYYAPGSEGGIHFADPDIGIAWPVSEEYALVSAKDRAQPRLAELGAAFRL
jgi:dTDP-4-dehydrorhamnose 3,5-epimerase